MTPRRKKAVSGWFAKGNLAKAGAVLVVLHQFVDLRNKTRENSQGTTQVATALAATIPDINSSMTDHLELEGLKRRVVALEQATGLVRQRRGAHLGDTEAQGTPQRPESLTRTLLLAPVKLVQGFGRWLFG